MLTAEEARVRLDAIRDPQWREGAAARVRKLRRKLRPIAEPFVAPPPTDQAWEVHQARQAAILRAGTALDAVSDSDRAAVFMALHEQLGPVLARWWVEARSQPYTAGWMRRAFRAPRAPAITVPVRSLCLARAVESMGPYDRDAVWLAAWAPHIGIGEGYGYEQFAHGIAGPLLAAAIDLGGPAGDGVLATLVEIVNGEHAIGVMGRHVIVGLLRCGNPEGWACIERLLLAAQRQEGLRQSILEAVDEGHPTAFDRMLDLVLEHDLLRFAATVRAAAVWLGFTADVSDIPKIKERVAQLRDLRLDPAAGHVASTGDAWDAYLGLCALAMHDVEAALPVCEIVLRRPDPDLRAAAARFLAASSLDVSTRRLVDLLDDPEVAVAMLAFRHVCHVGDDLVADIFDRYERLAERLPPNPRTVEALGIETSPVEIAQGPVVGMMIRALGTRPVSRMLRWFDVLDANGRAHLAMLAGKQPKLTPELRAVLVTMVGDRSANVRQAAVLAMGKLQIDGSEAARLEPLLTRKAGDLRRGVLTLLAKQPPNDVVRSAERLWAGDTAQRDAACELLVASKQAAPAVVDLARRWSEQTITETQSELLTSVIGEAAAAGADDPGLGLYDPRRRAPTPTPRPAPKGRRFTTDEALRMVSALDDLAEAHRDTPCTLHNWQGSTDVLLADLRWLPSPFAGAAVAGDDGGGSGLVLEDVFRAWWSERPPDQRSGHDGLDALRALAATEAAVQGRPQWEMQGPGEWYFPILRDLVSGSVGELRHRAVVNHVLQWMVAENTDTLVVDECLDAFEATLARVPAARLRDLVPDPETRESPWGGGLHWNLEWRYMLDGAHPWRYVLAGAFGSSVDRLTDAQAARWLGLERYLDEPVPGAYRHPVPANLLLRAHADGAATDDDIYDSLLHRHSRVIGEWTRRRRQPFVAAHPRAAVLTDTLRDRVLDIELHRGELGTPASGVALRVGSIEGAEVALELLRRLGRASLVRGFIFGNEGREAVYSHLLRVSYPADGDDAEAMRRVATERKVGDAQLVDLAVFAPQWAALVEAALGWGGLTDAIWWYHAHTKDERWSVAAEVRETWAALSAERTPLAAEDLVAGAVDVEWFLRARATLGEKRWTTLHKAAKLASGGNGHRRAQLFAEAMLGDLDENVALERIRAKRHQDSVRALGLIPLSDETAARDDALERRYAALREFERGSRKFGSQRQASEANAVRIGVENLARTAGYADPQRFVWAMEAAEAGELADGPIEVVVDDVAVVLSVDGEGTPQLDVRRGEKPLASIPAKVRKAEPIVDVRARKTALTRQATRVRSSLEAAMVRQDAFVETDFVALRRHPVVAPMLELAVFVDEAGVAMQWTRTGFTDVDSAGVVPSGSVRLAHPVDLAAGGRWITWQERLFADAKRQPFKQVFRELYVATEAEQSTGPLSRRWEGHQIQPRQAQALFGRRGWLVDREAGDVARVFHSFDLVARVGFLDGFGTPAEVELPTIECVYFTRRGDYVALPIEQVPPIVFSEVMRDLDLVVSVAHAGGVDPEASASTVEMRAALVRETSRALKLDNIRFIEPHVVIEGTLGEYSVHLGSGTVHRRPGGALCIIPVDAQRRGRIFLPFADDDPKSAEVLAKVLLLARDKTIKDPTILSQLRS
jgi:hypothetical protein